MEMWNSDSTKECGSETNRHQLYIYDALKRMWWTVMAQRLKCTLRTKRETRSRREGEEEVESVEESMLYQPSGGHVGEGIENEESRNNAF